MGGICTRNTNIKDTIEHANHPRDTVSGAKDSSDNFLTRSVQMPIGEETTTSFEDIRKVYKINPKVIGHGHFGAVRVATMIKSSGKKFAIKTIEKVKLKKDLHMLKRELEILKTLDHPNIVKFYETYQDEKFFHLVMEYCSGGELIDRITENGILDEYETAKIMQKLFSATMYLHDKGICHRDLKPENFLFSDKTADSEIKIIDFGLSKQFHLETVNETKAMSTVVGTALYVAPEVLRGKYEFVCDEWSLGVIMYILLSGNPPFYGENKGEIFNKVLNGKFTYPENDWKHVNKEAKDLISRLIQPNASKRLSAEKALKHPWFDLMLLNESPKRSKHPVDPNIIRNLKNFHIASRFKKEALKVIVNMLNEKEIKNLRETFRLIDKDSSGMISYEELCKAMEDLGYHGSQEELSKLLQALNDSSEANKEINYTEFITASMDKKLYMNRERLWATFKHFDVDNSNFITIKSLKEAMARAGRKLPNSELETWIKEIDTSKDGKISYEEFMEMMISDNVIVVEEDPNLSTKELPLANASATKL